MTLGPALNLHTHLEGSLRPATVRELAVAAGVPEPAGGWEVALRMEKPADLTAFLAHVAPVYPVLGSEAALTRAAGEAVEDAAADGCRYLELRAGPMLHVRPALPVEAVLAALCQGLAQGSAATGLPAGLVAAALRHHGGDAALDLARAAVGFLGQGVVGFDLAGDEAQYPDLAPYVPAYRHAAEHGLGLTAHAGEAGPPESVRQAAEQLGVARIGHGLAIAADPSALAWAAERGLCFEVCPTSNVFTGATPSLAEHPARALLEAGCRVVLGDDDPTVTGSRLSREAQLLAGPLGLNPEQIAHMSDSALAVAFLPADLRDQFQGAT